VHEYPHKMMFRAVHEYEPHLLDDAQRPFMCARNEDVESVAVID
jgi:hypothetical protein